MAADTSETLRLINKNIIDFPDSLLFKCEDIRILELSRNPGVRLNNVLGLFRNVEKIALDQCALLCVPEELGELTKLQELDLSGNNFATGLSPCLGRIFGLKKLYLSDCKLTRLPESLGALAQLEELDLRGSNFSKGLNAAIGKLRLLKRLNLLGCQITTIPDFLGDLEMLEELDLSWIKFSKGLHRAIGRLHRLKILKLRHCEMSALPEWFGILSQLEELDISENNFSKGLGSVIGISCKLRKLYLQDCNMTKLPEILGELDKIEELNLAGNSFFRGLSATLGKLRELKKLSIADCKMTRLPDSLGDLELLEDLDLSRNNLSKSPSTIIERLPRLKKLNLGDCQILAISDSNDPQKFANVQHQIEEWSKETFSNVLDALHLHRSESYDLVNGNNTTIPDLLDDWEPFDEQPLSGVGFSNFKKKVRRITGSQGYDLWECKMTTIPESLGHLDTLEELDLSRVNFYHGLYPTIGRLRRLRKLKLSHCDISNIPDWLGDLIVLEELCLSGSNFSNGLPRSVARLERLRKLELEDCKMSNLPDWFGNLKQLEHLFLSRNRFSNGLPSSIKPLHRLKNLSISNCELTALPDWIGDHTQLEELDLSANNFSEGINDMIGRLQGLKILQLRFCNVASLPLSFGYLQLLEDLDLTENKFPDGVSATIGFLHGLRSLRICSCNLKTLPNSFADLHLLNELDLSKNNFSCGVSPAIGRLRQLTSLCLDECKIETIPDSFGELPLLNKLSLKYNNLQEYPMCTLKMKHLLFLDLTRYERNSMTEQDATTTWGRLQRRITIIKKEYAINESNKKLHENTLIKKAKQSGITELPVLLAKTSLRELILDGNPVSEPPAEIWQQGIEAIKSYLREKNLGTDEMCPDTINMIGDVFAGKTSIAQSLAKGSPHPAAADDRTRVMQQLRAGFGENGDLLVNINDFGGHPIYHSVIPIFLPTDGLVILAYDMSRPVKEQEDSVERWLLTAIAKVKHIRVIVVGTRADAISSERRISLDKHMSKFASSLLNGAKQEVMLHINRQEHQSSSCNSNHTKQLHNLIDRLGSAKICVLSLSCSQQDEGLSALCDTVWKMLRKATCMPHRWFRVMRSMLDMSTDRPYLTLDEVRDLYTYHISDADGDKDLVVILRYLVTTSQIFWLENHETLSQFVFHSPQSILKACKNVLDHDQTRNLAAQWAELYAKDFERYAKGIVLHPFMMTLLKEKEIADVAIQFMKKFNLMSEITTDADNRAYVIPSNLPREEPRQMSDLEKRLKLCPNSIVIRISFIGSLLPMAFFETAISSMLTTATSIAKEGVSRQIWNDGLIILYDSVCFAARRSDNVLCLFAFSELLNSNPWVVLLPVVKTLHENVAALWHGATPECIILCPACRVKRQIKRTIGEIGTTLETLSFNGTRERTKPMCPQCIKTIPICLCYPIPRASLTPQEQTELRKYLSKYGMSSLGDLNHSASVARACSLSQRSPETEQAPEQSELAKRLRKATPQLVLGIDHHSLPFIIDALIAARNGEGLITDEHRHDIEAKRSISGKNRMLLEIVLSRGDEAIDILALALQSDGVRRPDLAKLITDV